MLELTPGLRCLFASDAGLGEFLMSGRFGNSRINRSELISPSSSAKSFPERIFVATSFLNHSRDAYPEMTLATWCRLSCNLLKCFKKINSYQGV